ncbi:hypothetical protein F5888DRAFT_1135407 [Russula emetica]|nr:hypothetical protein F5888DRAFT_1135407 [Russula emetica]
MTRIRGLPTVMKRLLSILGYLAVATSMGMHFAIGWTPAIIASNTVCCADTIASPSTIISDFPSCLIGLVPVACCAGTFQTQYLRFTCEARRLNL